MTYLINLVLALLGTLMLLGVNLASLHTLLHQHQDHVDGLLDACSLASGLFMDLIESRGGANTWLKQRVLHIQRKFELLVFLFK